jgi:hypothetical protein
LRMGAVRDRHQSEDVSRGHWMHQERSVDLGRGSALDPRVA